MLFLLFLFQSICSSFDCFQFFSWCHYVVIIKGRIQRDLNKIFIRLWAVRRRRKIFISIFSFDFFANVFWDFIWVNWLERLIWNFGGHIGNHVRVPRQFTRYHRKKLLRSFFIWDRFRWSQKRNDFWFFLLLFTIRRRPWTSWRNSIWLLFSRLLLLLLYFWFIRNHDSFSRIFPCDRRFQCLRKLLFKLIFEIFRLFLDFFSLFRWTNRFKQVLLDRLLHWSGALLWLDLTPLIFFLQRVCSCYF